MQIAKILFIVIASVTIISKCSEGLSNPTGLGSSAPQTARETDEMREARRREAREEKQRAFDEMTRATEEVNRRNGN